MADDVIATTRIYEEVPIPRSDRTRRVLRYGVGAVVPADDQKRLNVSKDGGQSKVPMAETDETGAVVPLPSSTAAVNRPTPEAQRDPVTPRKVQKKSAAAKRAAKRR